MTPEQKKQIDEMDYKVMFQLWRSSPIGHPLFQGDVGDYFIKVFTEKRKQLEGGEHARISKEIGWKMADGKN